MDALALLCNLYGDGPSTLKRLRAHGVLCIEDLGTRQPGEVATLLSLTQANARRFLKEASGLKKRVLENNDGAPKAVAKVAVAQPAVAKRAAREVVRGKDALLAAAARRWSDLDRESPLFPEVKSELAAKPIDSQSGLPLSAAELDHATHDALHAIGIRTLEELADLDSEVLSAAAGLGISQVLFVQGLARRKAREHAERQKDAPQIVATETLPIYVLPGPHSDGRFSPSERPPAEWLSVGAGELASTQESVLDEGAGPFA